MAELGKVTDCQGDLVTLTLKRREACGKCRACSAGLTEKDMEMKAKNLCGAKVGDRVEVFIEQTNFMKAVLIMYGVPFVFFMIGIIAGYYGALHFNIGNEVLISAALGIILTAAAFIIIHMNEDKWSNGDFLPVAKRIADENEEEE